MFARSTFLSLLVSLVLGLAACGGGDDAGAVQGSPGSGNVGGGGGGGGGTVDTSGQVVAATVDVRQSPRVATTATGDVWLVWSEAPTTGESIVVTRTLRDGTTQRWVLASAGTVRGVGVVMAGTTPVVSWWEMTGNVVTVKASALRNGAWVAELVQPLVAGSTTLLQMLPTAGGEVFLLWTENRGALGSKLMSARRSASGSWTSPHVIRAAAKGTLFASPAALAVATDGSAMVVWAEALAHSSATTPMPQALHSASYDPGSKVWCHQGLVDAGSLYLPQIASAGADKWVVVWTISDGANRPRTVQAKRFIKGDWSHASARLDAHNDEEAREVVLGASGSTVYAVWSSASKAGSAGNRLRSSRVDVSTWQWSAPAAVAPPSASAVSGMRLLVLADRSAAMVWGAQGSDTGPWLSRSDSSGAWMAAHRLELAGSSGNAPDLSQSTDGGLIVTWYRPRSSAGGDIVIDSLR